MFVTGNHFLVYSNTCSSLLGLVVSDEGKKFYNIDTWCQCFKTFLFAAVVTNKLECLSSESILQFSVMFVSKVGTYQVEYQEVPYPKVGS